ncbi:MAG: HupE/UreJ family protein [Candidatus Puniceispirillaceae bacterium]
MSAHGHEMRPAIADIKLSPTDVSLTIRFNAELFLADIDASQIEDSDDAPTAATYDRMRQLPPAELRDRFTQRWPAFADRLNGQAGGDRLQFELVNFISEEDVDFSLPRISTAVIRAPMPANETEVRFGWDARLGNLILRQMAAASAGPSIDPDSLYTGLLSGGSLSPALTSVGVATVPIASVISNYIKIGFIHIIPRGLDHILFVLGLFLYAPRWRPLLAQITIFTIAHSLTLALASRGLVSVPATIVEPMIAASIAYVALENLWQRKLRLSRLLIIFTFGLLHGLGFASVLADIGLPSSDFLISLISFNIGVELGQITVIAAALSLSLLLPLSPYRYRRLITIPFSLVIGVIGIGIAAERVIGIWLT